MSVSENIGAFLPYLRRYARALTGSQTSGDEYVRTTLEAALADPQLANEISASRAALYTAFNRIWKSAHVDAPDEISTGSSHEIAAQTRLSAIPSLQRQALLLTALEDFSIGETAGILGLSEEETRASVDAALAEIDKESTTQVLIIEDEPLIAMQLENLVTSAGHSVAGMAATRDDARAICAEKIPGLVLADIQLADGSSGIDAVEDILAIANVPVIFITAYPEKLLTGQRPEPTYLITKPFSEQTVRATMSQALFFRSGAMN